ncbi:hypothetical protein [Cellulomonas sp. S1-8]|uniref:hypothetical protein n=1 Tax=Cellulomonas sp. S1-8 TaxID=2904790 RepID=UPI002243F32D|nr:hypothetical protein [Cellulomonas sp. S1-8]UZN03424.1 hypothetical protein OKX07_00315 [Cellulomonas sp. S1-8]
MRQALRATVATIGTVATVAATLVLTAGPASAASCWENRTHTSTILHNMYLYDTGAYTRPVADGLIDREDLHRVQNSNAPNEVRDAATYFINNPGEFARLESINNGGRQDGLLNQSDLEAFRNQHGCGENCTANRTYTERILHNEYLFDTGSFTRPSADGLIDLEDLRRVRDGSSPIELRDAARYFLNNTGAWFTMDGVNNGGRTDGLVNHADLVAFGDRYGCG